VVPMNRRRESDIGREALREAAYGSLCRLLALIRVHQRDPGESRGILDPVARSDRAVVAIGFERYIRTGRFLCALSI